MKLEHAFEVEAPVETVWAALIDVRRVAPCLPGARLTGAEDDGTFNGEFAVKIGPASAAYRGTMQMEDVDEAGHRVTMRASGTDKRGQGGAKAVMRSTVTERAGGGSRVEVETDLTITGRLASFSRGGMMRDVSNRLLGEFADCLQRSLATEPAQAQAAASPAAAAGAAAGAQPGEQPPGPGAPPPGEGAAAGAPETAARPIGGLRLVLGVLLDRLRRVLGVVRDRLRRLSRR